MTTTTSSCTKSGFIREFEGLRGLLAAWVVFGHILLISGFTYQDGWFGILFSPVLGVYAFMMLSGFVISAALDRRPSSWSTFMLRRFFRLFPVYALCLALAIVLFDVSVFVSQSPAMVRFGPENLERLQDVEKNFSLYLLVDTTLLQCLLPEVWYPYANESFLVPTWSLTIEWLFYMVAPLLIWQIKKNWLSAIAGIGVGLALLFVFRDLFAAWNYSFSISTALYFLTGIASYYIWKQIPVRQDSLSLKFMFWGTAIAGFFMLNLPYKIWIGVMVIVMYERIHSRNFFFLEWPRRILNSGTFQFLGRTSYVTYLLHWIVIEMVVFWLVQYAPDINNKYVLTAICTVTVFPITYLISDIVHRRLEVPMINLPRRWKNPGGFMPAAQ